MIYQGFLTGNLMLDLAISAWFAAQVLKLLFQLAVERRSDLSTILKSGDECRLVRDAFSFFG